MRRTQAAVVAAAMGLLAITAAVTTVLIDHHNHAALPAARSIGGPFALTDQFGRPVTDQDLRGKPTLMFFGFTYCPDVCPTTLAALTSWMATLGPNADRLNVVYVTVDPERDTAKQLARYLSSFDHRIRGLTGTPAQIAQIAREYQVYYEKVPLDGGGYTVDHSSAIYLMDARGEFSGVIAYEEPSAQALAKIRALLNAR
jgi:protein SCO1/2